jgi:hypothetical protein
VEKIRATSVIFKNAGQRKQLPNGRKFAQSGHPEGNAEMVALLFFPEIFKPILCLDCRIKTHHL